MSVVKLWVCVQEQQSVDSVAYDRLHKQRQRRGRETGSE